MSGERHPFQGHIVQPGTRPEAYRQKPMPVEALQLREHTAAEMARWCGGEVVRDSKPSDPTDVSLQVIVPTLEQRVHPLTVLVNEYLVRETNTGKFRKMSAADFEAQYEKVHGVR